MKYRRKSKNIKATAFKLRARYCVVGMVQLELSRVLLNLWLTNCADHIIKAVGVKIEAEIAEMKVYINEVRDEIETKSEERKDYIEEVIKNNGNDTKDHTHYEIQESHSALDTKIQESHQSLSEKIDKKTQEVLNSIQGNGWWAVACGCLSMLIVVVLIIALIIILY